MADYRISSANLRHIETALSALSQQVNGVQGALTLIDDSLENTKQNVMLSLDKIDQLAQDFTEFKNLQVRANAVAKARGEIITIKQDIEKLFGHYDAVRRTTTGILQATDIGIIKKDTITTATENLMISTPRYLAGSSIGGAVRVDQQ